MAKTLTSLKYAYKDHLDYDGEDEDDDDCDNQSHVSSSEDTSTSSNDYSSEQPYVGTDLQL